MLVSAENVTMYALMLSMSVLIRNKLEEKRLSLVEAVNWLVAGVVEVVEVSFGVVLVTSERR